MLSSKTVFNLSLVLAAVGAIAIDTITVLSAEQAVSAACDTEVAYDKSGSLYCMELRVQSVKVARK